jgi:hypothetical protein
VPQCRTSCSSASLVLLICILSFDNYFLIIVFKLRDDHTQLVLDLLSNQECLWNVKSESYRNRNIRDKALEEMVKELNIPDLTPEDVKLKNKSIRSLYSSLLLIIIRQTLLETSLNDFYTNLDLHLSIQLTMCVDVPNMLRLIIHGFTHHCLFLLFLFF